ncbi:hypothetical protein MRQ36_27375 [Micromonospora sp. R77]|uniref:hypothetical protein n=1 Tax=Micromonospora sp. R77 TaxID=2925836 RepID=UPI001F622603|nr:hypothetical protein [Micromonospora sp. R77]MCI4066065.1 hypothetical protein [Micromonospora sp. R77]
MNDSVNMIDRLADLVGREVAAPKAIDWSTLIEASGHDFPPDYRRYVERFPPGAIGPLTVHHPGRWGLVDFVTYARNYHDVMNDKAEMEGVYPYHFGESVGDLCMWGAVQADYLLCWHITSASPSDWPTVVCDIAMAEAPELYNGTMAELLLDLGERRESVSVINYVTDTSLPYRFFPFA